MGSMFFQEPIWVKSSWTMTRPLPSFDVIGLAVYLDLFGQNNTVISHLNRSTPKDNVRLGLKRHLELVSTSQVNQLIAMVGFDQIGRAHV